MTDTDIIAHIKNAKYTSAFNGLYSMFPLVKKHIRHNGGDAHDAKDIFQDALVILCRNVNAGEFILTAPLKNYLLSVVKNCWLQEMRLRKKQRLQSLDEDVADADAFNEEPAFMFAKKAFESLGEKCKQLLILFYFNKQPFTTIATALGFRDDKTAKNQKYRCLQKAKETYLSISKSGSHA